MNETLDGFNGAFYARPPIVTIRVDPKAGRQSTARPRRSGPFVTVTRTDADGVARVVRQFNRFPGPAVTDFPSDPT